MIGAEENQLKDFIVGCLKSGEVPLCYLQCRIADVLPVQNLIENLVWTLLHHQSNKRSINQITMGLLFLQLMNYTERVQVGEQYLRTGDAARRIPLYRGTLPGGQPFRNWRNNCTTILP